MLSIVIKTLLRYRTPRSKRLSADVFDRAARRLSKRYLRYSRVRLYNRNIGRTLRVYIVMLRHCPIQGWEGVCIEKREIATRYGSCRVHVLLATPCTGNNLEIALLVIFKNVFNVRCDAVYRSYFE